MNLKSIMLCGVFAAAALLTGCSTIEVETTEWKAKIHSHWFQREMSGFSVDRKADGGYAIKVNEVKGDVSERLPEFTREMWAGLGFLGQLAAASINPAAASVTQSTPAPIIAPMSATSTQPEGAATTAATTAACADGSCANGTCTDGSCDIPSSAE